MRVVKTARLTRQIDNQTTTKRRRKASEGNGEELKWQSCCDDGIAARLDRNIFRAQREKGLP